VQSQSHLATVVESYLDLRDKPICMVCIDCKGVPDSLDLIQVGTLIGVFVIDCVTIGAGAVCQALKPLLESSVALKVFHDVHKAALALAMHGKVKVRNVLDTQLAAEHLWGDLHLSFDALLFKIGQQNHPTKRAMKHEMQHDSSLWSKRPLPKEFIEYAALDLITLQATLPAVQHELGDMHSVLVQASGLRVASSLVNDGTRSICFDIANGFAPSSIELMTLTRPGDIAELQNVVLEDQADEMVELLPEHINQSLIRSAIQNKNNLADLSDVIMDTGRSPQCWFGPTRMILSEMTVSSDDIGFVTARIGGFGTDNRAGLDGKLHRISAMRDRNRDISGLTMRVGRCVRGVANMIFDVLLGTDKSVLILGEPGSGKTTIVREATRVLAERHNVVVVDTSNEIAGDGAIPHQCIGLARRMMVPSLEEQSAVMIECVQNHTPHIMVIDEIGRPKEVNAARTVKQRGVRLIASAHGDLRRLLRNSELRGLVGGVESVTLGDAMAKQEASRRQAGTGEHYNISKVKAQRCGEPTFDIVIEIRRGVHYEWRVTHDVSKAVDAILDGQRYLTQRRTLDKDTNGVSLELIAV